MTSPKPEEAPKVERCLDALAAEAEKLNAEKAV